MMFLVRIILIYTAMLIVDKPKVYLKDLKNGVSGSTLALNSNEGIKYEMRCVKM